MGTKLPKELRYLSKALAELDDQDDLSDDAVIAPLRSALLERIAGLPEEKAQKRLDDDLERLEHWLEDVDDDLSSAHFILGYMMTPGLARELIELRAAEESAQNERTESGDDRGHRESE
ncbi:MAG: hypothetical protein H6819_02820 [Phycisphaerales bacterium]|nr:hypothetical protein [Phycisphaerales bacterium]MCB9856854.1 hypothetical protein [Phycisphaerales bacterium]MCB9862019.1 hypothetical protein [Phycisphaerales bacterium]